MHSSENEDTSVIINGKKYPSIVKNPLVEVSSTSFVLGIILGVSLGFMPSVTFKNINLYFAALSLFHFLEYYVTAKYNPEKVCAESFLIKNGKNYVFAHLISILEIMVESYFFPNWKTVQHGFLYKFCTVVGAGCVIVGQYVRSSAMITAGSSFSHVVKTKKNTDHTLIRHGVYAWFRHPSYFGYFWWAFGAQLMLLNPLSLIIHVSVLWKFFSTRIRFEELYLVKFFGEEYEEYRASVSVKIPFIN